MRTRKLPDLLSKPCTAQRGATTCSFPLLLDEVERVLNYPRVRTAARLTARDNQDHLNLLSSIAELIRPDPSVTIPVADPEDIHVIQAAISGRAEIIRTRDRHFFAPTVLEFCRSRGIQIMTDLDLLRVL